MTLRSPLLLALLLAASGCATPARLARVPGAPFAAVPAGQAWSVEVSGCEQPRVCQEVRSAVVGQLVGHGVAGRVAAAGQPAAFALSVALGAERPASFFQQVLYGSMRGGAQEQARVTASDLRTLPATVLRSYTVRSASVVHPFSLEAGQQDQYANFAGDIADGLQP